MWGGNVRATVLETEARQERAGRIQVLDLDQRVRNSAHIFGLVLVLIQHTRLSSQINSIKWYLLNSGGRMNGLA